MAPVLKHVVVGLACGGAIAVLFIAAGTVLMLSVFFGFCTADTEFVVGMLSAGCYQIAPIAGFANFILGVLGSMIHGRVQQRDRWRGIVPSNKPQEAASREASNRES
jgi:hypothetical protein